MTIVVDSHTFHALSLPSSLSLSFSLPPLPVSACSGGGPPGGYSHTETCLPSSAVLSTTLPTIGYTFYHDIGCKGEDKEPLTLYLFTPDLCYQGYKYSCTNQDGVWSFQTTKYATSTCTGTTTVQTYLADGNTCVDNRYKYNCQFQQAPRTGGIPGDSNFITTGSEGSMASATAPAAFTAVLLAILAVTMQRMQ